MSENGMEATRGCGRGGLPPALASLLRDAVVQAGAEVAYVARVDDAQDVLEKVNVDPVGVCGAYTPDAG